MEAQVSEILENILSLLSFEGSLEVEEKEEGVFASIETQDAGRLIGHQGETLAALQYIVNLIVSKKVENSKENSKRIILDVSNWRKNKEEDLAQRAKRWIEEVKETKEPLALEPMPSWQRRIVHMVVQETEGVTSESEGEGIDRHLVISLGDKKPAETEAEKA